MSVYHSTTLPSDLTSTNNEIEASFEMTRGTEEITINDELITNYDVAVARAESIFLEQSYTTKQLVVKTFHLDGISIGDICSVQDVYYKITKIVDSVSGEKAEMTITMKRWE